MNRKSAMMSLLLLALPLYACTVPKEGAQAQPNTNTTVVQTNGSQTAPGNSQAPASAPDNQADTFDYAALKEDALIRLDEEPRLASPIQTIVGSKPQAYTIYFREPMNKASVEQALRTQAEKHSTETAGAVMPVFSFAWANDRQLHLAVTAPEAKPEGYDSRMYRLDVSGASTQAGKTLKETPAFLAVVDTPSQIWKVSLDGKVREPLTSFEQPYATMRFLDEEGRYLQVSRFQQYCECDADYERLYSIYDRTKNTLETYPVEQESSYQGKGEFVADTRGFFYAMPAPGITVPAADTAIPIKLAEYVYGSGFSKDRTHVFLAVGKEGQAGDFDLLVRNLKTGEEKRFPQALKGSQQTSEVSNSKIPVAFFDDGKRVTFSMRHPVEYKELRYQYEWSTKAVSAWKPPVADDAWSGYSLSSDGMYQLYPNAGLFKDGQQIDETVHDGTWLNGTHQFVYIAFDHQSTEDTPYKAMIHLYDADTKKVRVIAEKLFSDTSLVGASKDGQWIYVQSKENLKK